MKLNHLSRIKWHKMQISDISLKKYFFYIF